MSEWIKTSKRRPTNGNNVLIAIYDDITFVCMAVAFVVVLSNNIYFTVGHAYYTLEDVKYWMPLPKPPKGE